MSRIGKNPVTIPDKVEVKIQGNEVVVKGPKGSLTRIFPSCVKFELKDKQLLVSLKEKNKETKSMWGLSRTLASNMVLGVSAGFTKSLEFTGVGYRAAVSGKTLTLNLGYSHPIDYQLPTGIEAKVNKNQIDISGFDKELVGLVAAKVRSYRPPEPYKGKGIKYINEVIIRKAGKSGAKK